MNTLFIFAPSIYHGGGALLLKYLLEEMPEHFKVHLYTNNRINISNILKGSVTISIVKLSLISRICAEISLSRNVRDGDMVLCFGNLPPLFKVKGDITVFIQDRHLVDKKISWDNLSFKETLRLFVIRAWLFAFRHKANRYFVQTISMKNLFENYLHIKADCVPLVPISIIKKNLNNKHNKYLRFNFIYVASGEPHKNHIKLIAAWRILAEENLFPSLALTLSSERDAKLINYIDSESSKRGLKISNLGSLPYGDIVNLYQNCDALIYPSTFESFGLPLLEAQYLNLGIIASELDYVRDIINPDETFDPHSSLSIARAVKRYMKVYIPIIKPVTPRDLFERLGKSNLI